MSTDRLYAAWRLLATTGMRRGELLGLRWRDLDLDRGRASISQSLVSVAYALRFGPPKSDRSRRAITLDGETVTALRDHRRAQARERLALGAGYGDGNLVFCREDGEPIHPDRFTKVFRRHVADAGLPRIRLHDVRHTYASLALQSGAHPKVVSERLGHANVSITLDTYSHVVPSLESDLAETVAALVR